MHITRDEISKIPDFLLQLYHEFVVTHLYGGQWNDLFTAHINRLYLIKESAFSRLAKDSHIEIACFNNYKIAEGQFKGYYLSMIDAQIDLSAEGWVKKRNKDLWFNNVLVLKSVEALANSKETNFPRNLWKASSISWDVFYEAVVVLQSHYDSVYLKFELVYENKEVYTLRQNLVPELLYGFTGEPLISKKRIPSEPILRFERENRWASTLAKVIRWSLEQNNITWGTFNKLMTYHAKKSPHIKKATVINAITSPSPKWDCFLWVLTVLGYTGLSLSIIAERESNGRQIVIGVPKKLVLA